MNWSTVAATVVRPNIPSYSRVGELRVVEHPLQVGAGRPERAERVVGDARRLAQPESRAVAASSRGRRRRGRRRHERSTRCTATGSTSRSGGTAATLASKASARVR